MDPVTTPVTFVRGQGTITFDPVQPLTFTLVDTPSLHREVTLYPYVFTATPANGWAFDSFEISDTQVWPSGSIWNDNDTGILTNPFSLMSDPSTHSTQPENWWGSSWLGTWTNVSSSGTSTGYYSKYEITAVFKRLPTNLLVNSSTLESPAKLVYDPTTNLLVGDY